MKTNTKTQAIFRFPSGMSSFIVTGDCMEPAIREGQAVLATEHTDNVCDIAPGVPVVVETDTGGIVKLWRGVRGDEILLRFLNDGNGRSGTIVVRNSEILKIWIVRGIWFGDTPFAAESLRNDGVTQLHVLLPGELPSQRMKHKRAAAIPADTHTLPTPKQSSASKPTPAGKKSSVKRSA